MEPAPSVYGASGRFRLAACSALRRGADDEAASHSTGDRLSLNYETSAAGSLRIEIQDAEGEPIEGFALDDSAELFGDSVEQDALWTAGSDVSRLAGQPVRLRFVLSDGDLYSFRFVESDSERGAFE